MAMAMAMMAYTELSSPPTCPRAWSVAGPVRVARAISCTGSWWVAV